MDALAEERLFRVHPDDEPLIRFLEKCCFGRMPQQPETFRADVRRIVAAGANPARCHALHYVLNTSISVPRMGSAEVHLLVELGCSVNAVDGHGCTPLHLRRTRNSLQNLPAH